MKIDNAARESVETALEKQYASSNGQYWKKYPKLKIASMWFNINRTRKIWQRIRDDSKSILDVGCGEAFYLLPVGAGRKVFGIEPSYPRALTARKFVPNVCRADGSRLPFKQSSFDTILCLEVVEHLTEDEVKSILLQLKTTLAPGGKLILSTPCADTIYKRLGRAFPDIKRRSEREPSWDEVEDKYSRGHINEYTPGRLADLLASLGYRRVRIRNGVINSFVFEKMPIPSAIFSKFLSFSDALSDILPLGGLFKANFIIECTVD